MPWLVMPAAGPLSSSCPAFHRQAPDRSPSTSPRGGDRWRGPKTIAAIARFQQVQLKIFDGVHRLSVFG